MRSRGVSAAGESAYRMPELVASSTGHCAHTQPGTSFSPSSLLTHPSTPQVFDTLIADPNFGGEYVSITPGHPKFVDAKRYQELVDAHIMFKVSTPFPHCYHLPPPRINLPSPFPRT